jgi:glycosyltransferase involved in cell wall biosynthesis
MALGCPVIVSEFPRSSSAAVSGAIFDLSSAADIARQILQLRVDLTSAALRQKGLERAAASWERTAAETLAVILKAAGRRGNNTQSTRPDHGRAR